MVKINTRDENVKAKMYSSSCSVMLDGEYVDGCIAADDEMGYVMFIVRDAFGKVLLDTNGKDPLKLTKFGRVEIVHPALIMKATVTDSRKLQKVFKYVSGMS